MPAYNEHPPQWQPVKELHACYDIQATPDEIPEDRDKLIQYVLTSGDYEVAHYQGNEAAQLSVATEIADEILISRGALTSLVNSGGKREVEEMVSKTIRAMPFIWLEVGDGAGGSRTRDCVERNAIALLSNLNRPALDPPSPHWLGRFCKYSDKVKPSGLWNDKLVTHSTYDPKFIDRFQDLVKRSA